jgi:hypothetical protein
MKKIHSLLSVVGVAMAAACIDQNPTEIRVDGSDQPVVAQLAATVAPVGTATVNATLAGSQKLGYHMDVTFNVTGTPNATYQWRIFRGSCAETAAAATVASPGLWVFATVQSYPDAVLNATGTTTITRSIAGVLDSQTAYSVRIRAGQASTNFNGTSPLACGNLQLTPGG